MNRHILIGLFATAALGALLAAPAVAGDDESALEDQVTRLEAQFQELSATRQTMLEQEIESYLSEKAAYGSAQGEEAGALDGLSLAGRLTAVSQSTTSTDPRNVSVVAGDVDLDFWMQVTERLSLFVYLTASSTDRSDSGSVDESPPYVFGPFGFPGAPNLPNLLPNATFSGLFDGVGVDGTMPVKRGSITVREAGIQEAIPVGQGTIHWEIGALDPRMRFLQNSFADDENTQFLDNLFDDDPAISWMSDASGRTVFGIYGWYGFGANEAFTVSTGYFNTPGEFWSHGPVYVQFAWKGEVRGREMNFRAMYMYDAFFPKLIGTASTDGDSQYGFSWDWLVTDSVGVFVRFAGNTEDVNPVHYNVSFGGQWKGFWKARADDTVGVAVGVIKANEDTFVVLPEDTEWHIEAYYKFFFEDGKVQISPSILYVSNPGGAIGFVDDSMFLLGLRIFVPF